jgi:hypothetical protein
MAKVDFSLMIMEQNKFFYWSIDARVSRKVYNMKDYKVSLQHIELQKSIYEGLRMNLLYPESG